MEYSALIVAAGQGRRMNLGYNKVFYTFADGKRCFGKDDEHFRGGLTVQTNRDCDSA